MKGMVWLTEAPLLQVPSFYSGLLTAITWDTGHEIRESRLKVTHLHCPVLTGPQLFRLELGAEGSKATRSQTAGGRGIVYASCSVIEKSFISNPRLKNTTAGTTLPSTNEFIS